MTSEEGLPIQKNEGMVHSFLKGNQAKRNTCMLMIREHSYVLIKYFGKGISNSFEPLFYQHSIFFCLSTVHDHSSKALLLFVWIKLTQFHSETRNIFVSLQNTMSSHSANTWNFCSF